MVIRRFVATFAVAALLVGPSALTAGAQSLAPAPVPAPAAPEIDAGALSGAVAMLVCGALLFMANGRRRAPEL